jgi:hypothetical protein
VKRLLACITLAASALWSGCSGAPPTEAQVAGLIHQIQNAPNLVAHSGVRRVESYYTFNDILQPEIYREEVIADGHGQFRINPITQVQGNIATPTEFKALHFARMGFHWRYRDFLVRDLGAFGNNYTLTAYGQIETIAGRTCHQVRVERKDLSAAYEVALDTATGLVLRYRQYDERGALYSLMEYETYNPTPDLTGVEFHKPRNGEVPLVNVADLGFTPVTPKILADSAYTFLEGTIVNHPLTGEKVAKLTFTDGVETIFFLDLGPSKGVPAPATTPSAKAQTSLAGMNSQEALFKMDVLRLFHEGPLSVMWGHIGGHSLVALGKTPHSGLQMMLESAVIE